MKTYTSKQIGKMSIDFGWFPNEYPGLISFRLLDMLDVDAFYVFEIKTLKFCFSVSLNFYD